MKTTLRLVGLVIVAWFLTSCGDTNNYYYFASDAEDDAWVEPDESPPNDIGSPEPDESTPPTEDVEEEWAPGCNPPEWMVDPGWATCEIDEDFFVDFCQLVWDKPSCTATCVDDYPPPPFHDATPEAVSGELGCYPAY